MIGDMAKELIIQQKQELKYATCPYLKVTGEPILPGETPNLNHDIFQINKNFGICYMRRRTKTQGGVYKIITEIAIDKRVYYIKSYEEFVELAKTDKALEFMLKFTCISKLLFDLAKDNEEMRIPFGMNWDKYVEHIKSKTDKVRLNPYKED